MRMFCSLSYPMHYIALQFVRVNDVLTQNTVQIKENLKLNRVCVIKCLFFQ